MRMGKAPLPVPTEATKLMRLHRVAQDRRGDLPRSMDKREIHLKAFARYLAPSGLMDATRQDIELFPDKRRTREGRKIGSHTRYLWIAHLHAFYKWAVLEELVDVDPTVAIVRPKTRRTLPRPIEDKDLILAIRVTQELLGHQSPNTTAGYVAYSHVAAAEAVGSLRLGA
jgi:site-specific recombinase XerD